MRAVHMMEEGREEKHAQWQQMEDIYHAALPLAIPERRAFVAQRCAGDAVLEADVNSLLLADDFASDFLQEPVAELGLAILADESLRDTEIISQPTQQASNDLVGEKVAERYEVIKKLGVGGFGDVYKATDAKVMSRPVIIKILKDEILREEGEKRTWVLTKFRQEIEALAKIDDPGAVRILDADALPDGRPYIVMEFVEGSDLRHFIRDARREHITEQGLKFQDVAEIVRQAGRTLTAAHDVGIFHRDLKPENIMLRRNRSGDLIVKVIDFGIAKVKNSLVASSTATGHFNAGTWQYMGPEQLCRKKVDAACDIYALGVIAYELLTGRYPFPAKDSATLKEMQEAGVKVKPRDLNPDIPAAAQEAILKALEYYPADRHKRARDFGDELFRALASDEELVRPIPVVNVEPEGKNLKQVEESERNKSEGPVIAQSHISAVPESWLSLLRRRIYIPAAVLLAGLIGVVGWALYRMPGREGQNAPRQTTAMPDAGPERSLTFWLRVREPQSDGTFAESDSTGEEAFRVGSIIDFRVQPVQDGYLYIINEGMGDNGAKKWTAVFPNTTDNNGSRSARLIANRQQKITGMTLDDNPGDEMIHFVWAADAVRELEPLFQSEFRDKDQGVFGDPTQQNALRDFFERNKENPEDKIFDNNAQPPRITFKGRGGILVGSLTIKHRKVRKPTDDN
jgi:serine/threonine protein kinase